MLAKSALHSCRKLALATAVAFSFGPATAFAVNVGPGLDMFVTQPGTEIDLSGLGLGVVPLEGVPFNPGLELNGADTIVERMVTALDPIDTVPIEIVEMQLRSTAPVDLTPIGGPFIGVFSDLWVTIGGLGIAPQINPLSPSIGQMTIEHTSPNGGIFRSCIGDPGDQLPNCGSLGVPGGGVYADAIFVFVGGDPFNPLDVILSAPAPRFAVASVNSSWAHPAGLIPPTGPFNGQSSNFQIGTITQQGPHQVAPAFPLSVSVPALSSRGTAAMIALFVLLGALPLVRYTRR